MKIKNEQEKTEKLNQKLANMQYQNETVERIKIDKARKINE